MMLLCCSRSALLLIFYFCHAASGLAVMSVDIGTEWMKVAIVSPGVPMEIALNRESQRKTPVIVAFREGDRSFSDPALSVGVRFPDKAYSYLLDVLGKKIDNPIVKLFLDRFPYYKVEGSDDRGTVVFKHPEGQSFTPEELVAMILKQAKQIAQKAAGQPIKDAVITVPPFFSQAERQALLLAAQMSGLNVLQLLNSNTATALNYGVFRRRDFNDSPTNILFYDMGAGSTVATIVSYQLVKSKETGEIGPQLTVKGVGFDRTLGGLEMQLRLRDHFAKMFNKEKKTKSNVFENSRSMAKLLKEAGRIKKVLSANTDHVAQVESLIDDVDFRCPISREEFENLCSDLFKRVIQPIETALSSAGLSMDLIDQVILSGSNTRVPKVQQILLDYVKKPELGKSINTDESAVMGAAYQAAYLSKGFKVKTFLIRDINVYPIQVNFNREYESNNVPAIKSVKRTLFGRNNLIPQKKAMTFNRLDKDFDFYVNYGELNFLSDSDILSLGSLNISKVNVRGIAGALEKHTGSSSEYKGAKAYFRIDESGNFHFDSVEALFEKSVAAEEESRSPDLESALSKLGNTIGRLFSSYDKEKTESVEEAATQEPAQELNTNSTQAANSSDEESAATNDTKQSEPPKNETETGKKETKIVLIKEPLEYERSFSNLQELSEIQVQELVKRLEELDAQDHKKLTRDKIKNSLESFIVESKDKLYRDEFEKALSDTEKGDISKALSEAGDWLEYESDNAETDVFRKKLSELKKLTMSWFERVKEHQERPEAVRALKEMLNISGIFLLGAMNMTDDEQMFTLVELTTLEKLIVDTHAWLTDSVKEQDSLPFNVAPKLTLKLISEKLANLDREVKYLLNKARFTKPLKKKETEQIVPNKTDATNETKTEKDEDKNETKPDIPETVIENETQLDDIPKTEDPEHETATTPQPVRTASESPEPDKVKEEDAHTEL